MPSSVVLSEAEPNFPDKVFFSYCENGENEMAVLGIKCISFVKKIVIIDGLKA